MSSGKMQVNPIDVLDADGVFVAATEWQDKILESGKRTSLLLSHSSSLLEEENSHCPDQGVHMGIKRAAQHCISLGASLRRHAPRDILMTFL